MSRLSRRTTVAGLVLSVLTSLAVTSPAHAAGDAYNGNTCSLDLTAPTSTTYSGTVTAGPWAIIWPSHGSIICQLQATPMYSPSAALVPPWATTWSEPAVGTVHTFDVTSLAIPLLPTYYLCTKVSWAWTNNWGSGGDTYQSTPCTTVNPTQTGPSRHLLTGPIPQYNDTVYTTGGITIENLGSGMTVRKEGVFDPAVGQWSCTTPASSGPATVTCTPSGSSLFTWGCWTMDVSVSTTASPGAAHGTGDCNPAGTSTPVSTKSCPAAVYPCADVAEGHYVQPTVQFDCTAANGTSTPVAPYTVSCVEPVQP